MKNYITVFIMLTMTLMFNGCMGEDSGSGNRVDSGDSVVLSSIEITPTDASIVQDTSQQFSATGIYSDSSKKDITKEVTWTSSDKAVATIDESGIAAGLSDGTTTINAALSGVNAKTTLAVRAVEIQSIRITPTDTEVPSGLSLPFTATGTFSDHTEQDITENVQWSSSEKTVATISNTAGTKGIVDALQVGETEIKAAFSGIDAKIKLNVSPAILLDMEISPKNASAVMGTQINFKAIGIYSDDSKPDITNDVSWSSSDEETAIVSNEAGSKGKVYTLEIGTTSISAALDGINSVTLLTVVAAELNEVIIKPSKKTMPKGTSFDFVAEGRYTDGSTSDLTKQVAWSSSNELVAIISNADGLEGSVSAKEVGTTTLTASMPGGISSTAALTVVSPVLKEIVISPRNESIEKGDFIDFSAIGTYTDNSNKTITNEVDWSSSDTKKVRFVDGGRAFARKEGKVDIGATYQGVSDTTKLTVKDD